MVGMVIGEGIAAVTQSREIHQDNSFVKLKLQLSETGQLFCSVASKAFITLCNPVRQAARRGLVLCF